MRTVELVIDGADEGGTADPNELLAEARVLVRTWPSSTVLVTARPIGPFERTQEGLRLPSLDLGEIADLVTRVARADYSVGYLNSLPASLKDAVSLPLFAVMLGAYRARSHPRDPFSLADLIASVIDSAVPLKLRKADAGSALRWLAARAMERGGGAVPVHEVASDDLREVLLASRFVSQESQCLAFHLRLFTDWFAAKSLADEIPAGLNKAEPRVLDLWENALTIACGVLPSAMIDDLLKPIAIADPGFAASVVANGVARWAGYGAPDLPPAKECGVRLRIAMQAWCEGLGRLAQEIGPCRPDGTLPPLGLRVEGCSLVGAWHEHPGTSELEDIFDLPEATHPFDGWRRLQYSHPAKESAWSWRWTLEDLRHRHADYLDGRPLVSDTGALFEEAAWDAAIALTGRGSLDQRPIPVVDVKNALQDIQSEDDVIRIHKDHYHVGLLRKKLSLLQSTQENLLKEPWPSADIPTPAGPGRRKVWAHYTPHRLLDRVRAVYGGAIEAYEWLVPNWFPRFSHSMKTYLALPAILRGWLVVNPDARDYRGEPTLVWRFEPLPRGSASRTEIEFAETVPRMWEEISQLRDQVRQLRPELSERVRVSGGETTLRVFQRRPATELAYKWLVNDLRAVYWLDRDLKQKY